MDVTCERCSTEYEFDDALVSERGTTVKCTNCGHQFKVRRNDGVSAPERWLVRTVDGRELEFTALRELQGAIAHARITRDDVLSRGGSRPRRLGSIAELEPFFSGAIVPNSPPNTSWPVRSRVPTPTGLGGPTTAAYRNEGSVAIPLPIAPGSSAVASPIAVPAPSAAARAPVQRPAMVATLPGVVVPPGNAPAVPTQRAPERPPAEAQPGSAPMFAGAAADMGAPRSVPDDAPTLPRGVSMHEIEQVGLAASQPVVPPDVERASDRVSEPPRAEGRRAPEPLRAFDVGRTSTEPTSAPATPTPADLRASFTDEAAYTDPRFSSMSSSKQTGRVRWIAAVVVVGTLIFLGSTVGLRYLAAGPRPAPEASAPAGTEDERVGRYLQAGEASLLSGDLEAAKEQIDKASGVAEDDPRVALAAARLAVVRADLAWLRVRLLPADAPDFAVAQSDATTAAERVRAATERAAKVAGDEAAVSRLRVDAARLAGDTAGARKLLAQAPPVASQPDAAVSLAALDLTEEQPEWRTVIERLRAAAGREQGLGRARALLVYALARSDAAADARSELDRMAAAAHPLPVVGALRAYLDRAAKDGKGRGAGVAVDVGALPDARRPVSAGGPAAPARPPAAPLPGGRVPDDYVWPGYGDDAKTAAPVAPTSAPSKQGDGNSPSTTPAPKPDTPDPPVNP
jgi:predicted Zn finger-like uncharacterized protein